MRAFDPIARFIEEASKDPNTLSMRNDPLPRGQKLPHRQSPHSRGTRWQTGHRTGRTQSPDSD